MDKLWKGHPKLEWSIILFLKNEAEAGKSCVKTDVLKVQKKKLESQAKFSIVLQFL